MPQSNILSLDRGRRLKMGNTTRADCYVAQFKRLSPNNKHRLVAMEDCLFRANQGLVDCTSRLMNNNYSTFECPFGSITWYFSTGLTKFVLLDFDFSPRDTGGDLGDDPSLDEPAPPFRVCCVRTDKRRAALIGLLQKVAAARGLDGNCFARLSRHDIEHLAPFATTRLPLLRLPLVMHPLTSIHDVPRWSLLMNFVETPEQLQNAFARSIVAGEFICRVAVRALPARKRNFALHNTPHLDDFRCALENMFCERIGKEWDPYHFFFINRTKAGLLSDDTYLSIARSEICGQLSLFVSHSASFVMRKQRSDGYLSEKRKRTDLMLVMKKYALLADFVNVSEGLFASGRPARDGFAFDDFVALDSGNRRDLEYLKAVELLDMSIHLIWSETQDDSCRSNDVPLIHRRLLDLTKEILVPFD